MGVFGQRGFGTNGGTTVPSEKRAVSRFGRDLATRSFRGARSAM